MTDYTDRSTEALLARRALAEKATPGPWIEAIEHEGDFDDDSTFITTEARREKSQLEIAKLESTEPYEYQLNALNLEQRANAAHIAANSPDVVTADIDEILHLRKENEKLASVLKIQLQEAAVELLNGAMRQYTEGDGEVFSLGVTCPHCDMHFSTVEEAVAHDAVCLNHPASIRAERIEKEANWLATAAANNGWHGVRVSPGQMREAARKAVEEE